MRAAFYVNPRSRSGAALKSQAVTRLAELSIDVVDLSGAPPKRLPAVVGALGDRDCVIIGGGDGTINQLLGSLVKLELPVGLLPLGTANDLAATLGISTNINEACQTIAEGKTRHIDLGRVNGRYFVNEASMGLSNSIIRDLNPTAKKFLGVGAAVGNAMRALLRARRFRARVRWDDTTEDISALQITVGNGERFGGLIQAPEADINDHQLELYALEICRFRDMLHLIPALIRGRYTNVPGVRLERGREIEIHTKRAKAIYTDGEFSTTTPALFEMVPSALAIFAPPATRK